MGELGGIVTITFSAPSEPVRRKSRTALLPLLILLFMVSYTILTLLVIEQGRTIDSQRVLLKEMLKDSNQLAELKTKLATEDVKQKPAQPPAQAKTDSRQPAANKPPASPEKDVKRQAQGRTARSLKTVPEKPAADLEDVRRATHIL